MRGLPIHPKTSVTFGQKLRRSPTGALSAKSYPRCVPNTERNQIEEVDMKMTIVMATAAIGLCATSAIAQGPSAVRLRLEPGSEITVLGTSTLHDFHCKTEKINAYVDVDPAYTKDLTKVARPIVSVKVTI